MRSISARLAKSLARRRLLLLVGWLGSALIFTTAAAQDRFVEDVQISRSGNEAEIVIQLACPMRFQADVAMNAGILVEVRVAPFDTCRQFGSDISSELHRPVNGRLAYLIEIAYESLGIGDSLLLLRFDRPVAYRVRQGGDLRSLYVTLDLDSVPDAASSVEQVQRVAPRAEPAPELSERARDPGRRPLMSRVVEPSTTADYMINLQSTREAVDPSSLAATAIPASAQMYISRTTVDGQSWFRLRLGFFESEAAARTALEPLSAAFPRAWIGRADAAEIQSARDSAIESGARTLPTFVAEPEEMPATATGLSATAPLSDERIAVLAEEGREALLEQRYDDAIAAYTELVRAPGAHRPQAAEYLALAYERAGRSGQARAQYEWYLREFPESPDVPRVRQRLNGIVLAAAAPQAPLREADSKSRWETAFGLSQYYRQDVYQFDVDQEEITTFSALLSDVDYSVRRNGDQFAMSTRLSFNHVYDLLGEDGPGDQQRVSYAYFDLEAQEADWWLRIGRQSQHRFGVLGRFDGAQIDYGWGSGRRAHFMMGYPVELTRDSIETARQFYGAAVEFDDLVGKWDISAFVNAQTIEGVNARMAVGTEIRYSDDRRSFSGIFDYDVDFGEINTALMLGTWRLQNRMTLSALFDSRKSPILTTRNALIGQPVATIEEMLLVWTEEEIRQLAVDRTTDSSTVTLGIAAPIAQRFQVNFDATITDIGGTIASGGVAAIESTGQQIFYSTSLVGSGLFKTGDVTILNLRLGSSDRLKSTLLTWDARFPIGQRIRINPRLQLSVWEALLDSRRRETVSPRLRVLMNTRSHYRLEFEIGVNRQLREDAVADQEASGRFFNFGYRANF
jgi:tetratricopeptide (TPR) repeat protein